jgi:hypothetical protein
MTIDSRWNRRLGCAILRRLLSRSAGLSPHRTACTIDSSIAEACCSVAGGRGPRSASVWASCRMHTSKVDAIRDLRGPSVVIGDHGRLAR